MEEDKNPKSIAQKPRDLMNFRIFRSLGVLG